MNQPAIACRFVLTVIACTLALSCLWLWLRPPEEFRQHPIRLLPRIDEEGRLQP